MIDQYLDIKSIDPIYWGKSGWIFLNSIALTYKPEHKEKYKLFIQQLPWILPCRSCGNNLVKNIDSLDDALSSKEKFLNWLLKIRNDIYEEQLRPTTTVNNNINEIFFTKYSYTGQFYTVVMTIISVCLVILLIWIFKKNQS
jgi:hypothetical protein